MRSECLQAVGMALGRSVTQAEGRNIERRLADATRREATRDPDAWQALSATERAQRGAEAAAQELMEQAQLKRVRLAKTIVAHDRMRNFVTSQLAGGFDTDAFHAFGRMIAAEPDNRNNIHSADDLAKGIQSISMGKLFEVWETVHSNFSDMLSGALGRESQSALESLLVRALHGEDVGRPEITKAAQAFHEVAEDLRQQFNAEGGEIHRLANWGMSHTWSDALVAKAGPQGFVDFMLPLLDKKVYVHEDGTRYTDTELQGFLQHAFVSITTGGANQPLSEVRGAGMRAGRHAESRQLHFKDGESALAALSQFSETGVLSAMAGHVKRMSRDIALIKQFGPNSDLAVAKMLEELNQQHRLAAPGKTAQSSADVAQRRLETLYDHLAGRADQPLQIPVIKAFGWQSDYTVHELFSDLRALATASSLGSALIPSITDQATMHLTAHVNGIDAHKLFLNQLATLDPTDRTESRIAGRQGLLVHTMIDDLNRWGTTNLRNRGTGKLANSLLRASGLTAWTESGRRAYSRSMMDALGALSRERATLAELSEDDHSFLKHSGVTEKHWAIWRLAQPEVGRGTDTLLTAQSIYRIPDEQIRALLGPTAHVKRAKDSAATALMGFVLREQDTAVITPGVRERAFMHGRQQAGTWSGELVRSFWLFKSFPVSMVGRHLGRVFRSNLSTGQRLAYGTALIAATTVLGALAVGIMDVLNGRDPRSFNPTTTKGSLAWVAGFLKGGAMGIYGDLLFADPGGYGRSYIGTLEGPVLSQLDSGLQLTVGNLNQYLRGEKTNFGAEAVRFAKSETPFANLWYTKAVTDHLIFQQLQEYFSPGYLRRYQAQQKKDYGFRYWWAPGQTAPARAPDPTTAAQPAP